MTSRSDQLDRLQRHERDALDVIRDVALAHGCDAEVTGRTGKSHVLVAILRGRRRIGTTTISSSPRDRDACLRDVRRSAGRIIRGVYGHG